MPTLAATAGPAEARIRAAIAQAADRTGVDFGYLYNQARIESSLNPQARAGTSSAAGLFQFTRQSWLEIVNAHGADHGAGWAAAAISRGSNGLTVADPQMRQAVENLRFDPEFASAMAGELAADNRDRIEGAFGRSAEPVDLYLAHFLGSAGAVNFLTALEANPDAPAAPLFPAAAAANRSVFYDPAGSPRSLSDIRASFAARLEGGAIPPGGAERFDAAPLWVERRHTMTEAAARPPMQLAAIEPMPGRLSPEFAARAYQRLAGIGG